MNKFTLFICVGLAVFFINKSMKDKPTSQQLVSTPSLPAVSTGYGFDALKNNWPTLNNTQTSSSDNWLAANYLLIFDGSGSMDNTNCGNGQRKIVAAKEAMQTFINDIPQDANVGLYVFDNADSSLRVPLGINNRATLKQAIYDVKAGGTTPLKSSLTSGYTALEKQAEKQLGYGEYNVVIVTDGDASVGEEPEVAISRIYQNSPVTIHTIGFCIGNRHALNAEGITYYQSANNPEKLLAGLQSVLAESAQFDVSSFN
ncbi:vWA domain-containing protein [Photobacterium leiognathi]|uniref:von Willebrand factor type A domain protein n=1 Tax=Photobacterium leiognathi lrivu.4.1 TaxID=1248232 RepID=V5F8B9_PHOLE|nr:VWA domain-containing protein [Photobacterium leiognathi]GAD32483.1 von Willebrand factor type A domain protein [Photobacterium leiognathi lrivu.4.1]